MHAFMHINMYACACKSAWEVCHHWCLWKPQEARSIVLYFLSLFYWFLSQEQQKLNWSKLHIMTLGCHNIWELLGISVWMKCSFEYKFLLGLVTNEKKIENYIAAIFVRLGPVKRWCARLTTRLLNQCHMLPTKMHTWWLLALILWPRTED